jgi:hypothetical protein
MHAGCKPRHPPIRSTPIPTPAADRIAAACERATADGTPITHAYLQSATGMGKDSVWHAVAGMRGRGEWRWTLVLQSQLRAARRAVARRAVSPKAPAREAVPTPAEIRWRSRDVLVGEAVGMPPEEADRRLSAKAMRYGD